MQTFGSAMRLAGWAGVYKGYCNNILNKHDFKTKMSIEKITEEKNILAIVVRSNLSNPGLNFFTPNDFPFQLGIHLRKKHEFVPAHKHSPFKELKNLPAQEFFYVEEGKVEVDMFNGENKQIKKTTLNKGDMILLNCGHSIKFLEDSKLIELKQGPYRGREEEKSSI